MSNPEFVELHFLSTKPNPMFKDKPVPYMWTHTVGARRAEEFKAKAEAEWPDVTVTIKPKSR